MVVGTLLVRPAALLSDERGAVKGRGLIVVLHGWARAVAAYRRAGDRCAGIRAGLPSLICTGLLDRAGPCEPVVADVVLEPAMLQCSNAPTKSASLG